LPSGSPSGFDPQTLKGALQQQAQAAGFDLVAVTTATLPPQVRADLNAYVADGRHGTMGWMADTLERRAHPQGMWPEAVSAVVLGMSYAPGFDPLALAEQPERGVISAYARNRDYHDLIKKRLKQVARWLHQESGEAVKVFVDTAPLMEKPLAAQAGAGWQGKHTNLVSRRFGSWLFLGEILTTAPLPADPPETDHCGRCQACLSACPTGAFDGPGRIDPRRCVSYLTIEHDGPLPRALRPLMGNRVYGCDDCLAVCPWNKFAQPHGVAEFMPRAELMAPRLTDLAALSDEDFRTVFAGSPIKRAGRVRMVRNALNALGNSGATTAIPLVEQLLSDESPVVRGAAVWALSRLDPARAARLAVTADDPEPSVAAEWAALKD
jgi:epoxyqueuosine reductase